MAYLDTKKARNSIVSLLPNDEYRRKCLSLFAEALKKADSLGRDKWGAYYTSELFSPLKCLEKCLVYVNIILGGNLNGKAIQH